MLIILEISRHPNGTWLMYLSEATSNVLKFIYAILVSNNDERLTKTYNLHKSAANIISELNSFLSIILATPTSKADYYLLTCWFKRGIELIYITRDHVCVATHVRTLLRLINTFSRVATNCKTI